MIPPVIVGVIDEAKALEQAFMATANQVQMRPQMQIMIFTNTTAEIYNRIKFVFHKIDERRWKSSGSLFIEGLRVEQGSTKADVYKISDQKT